MVLRKVLKFFAVLMIGLVLTLALGVGIVFWTIRNFDPNSFRGELEKAIVEKTGFEVRFGDMRLTRGAQPELQIKDIILFSPSSDPAGRTKILQSPMLRLHTDLTGIWQKRFLMPRITIQNPEIFLKRNAQGVWNWQPIPVSKNAPVKDEKPSPGESQYGSLIQKIAGGWVISLGEVEIQGAAIHLLDETARPAVRQDVTDLNLTVSQKSWMRIFNAHIEMAVLGSKTRNLGLDADLDIIARSIDFVCRYGVDQALLKGQFRFSDSVPHFDGTLDIRGLDLDSVIPETSKKGEYVNGLLSAQAEFTFDGLDPDLIKRSLQGHGNFEIRNGAYKNRNLIKEIFDRMESVVGVIQGLGGELPPEVRRMTQGPDTLFQSVSFQITVAGGTLDIAQGQMIHPDYQVSGNGAYGILNKRVDAALQLFFSKSISQYLVQKIHELQYLLNKNGQILIPFRYSGVLPEAAAQPDLGYLTQQFLQAGAQQLLDQGLAKLSKFLEKKL